MTRPRHRSLPLVILLAIACGRGEDPAPALSAMNRGIGLMERFDYLPAVRAFEEALVAAPGWTEAKMNLAIALLNLQGPENHRRANEVCAGILARDPRNPHANFVTGVLGRVGGDAETALPYFERVLESDPRDAASWYWRGCCLQDLGRREEADVSFERATREDPYLVAALHQRYYTLTLLRRRDDAERVRQEKDRLQPPPEKPLPFAGNLLTAKAYHEFGRYAMILRDFDPASDLRFAHPTAGPLAAWRYGGEAGVPLGGDGPGAVSRIGPGIAVGDVDGDGDADLFVPEWGGPGKLFRNDGRGRFSEAGVASGIETPARGVAAIFFDADGDGDPDLFVSAAGPDVFYRNEGGGVFRDATAAARLAGDPGAVHAGVVAVDFDQEGDIDLFVACLSGPDSLLRNNRDGTFTDVAEEMGVAGGNARSVGALSIDVDRDFDTDLLVIRDRGPAALFRNERVRPFREAPLPPELAGTAPAFGAAAGDIDRDGFEEIVLFRGPEADAVVFRADRDAKLAVVPGLLGGLRWRTGVFLDADLDGTLDLMGDDVVLFDPGGRAIRPSERTDGAAPETARGIAFADFDGDGDIDRIAATPEGLAFIATEAPHGNRFVALILEGREQLQPAAWSARAGPDAEVELRAGNLWTPLRARTASGFLSTVEETVRFGLGNRKFADVVRILWPDRVLQVEAEIPAGEVKRIREVNRKPASCPMLFCFDGERFRFVSDFLGVGGLGFYLGPGLYGTPDPDETLSLSTWPRPVDGEIVLAACEPLEEITYFDAALLLAVDHPAPLEVVVEERYAGEPARFPSGRLLALRERILPRAAADREGRDCLAAITSVDRVYQPLTPDLRFPGVAREHATTFDFTDRVPEARGARRLWLLVDGWLEYGYSNTFHAAWQANVPAIPPALEVPDGAGGWKVLVENIGCPAGLPKSMAFDVTGLVTPGSPVFRLRSNYEVYYDRVTLAVDEGTEELAVHELLPSTAVLRDRGYPREYSPDGRLPLLYDYGIMDPGYPFKRFAGSFTRFGDVRPLLLEADDRYVVFGHGEELTLRFRVDHLPPPGAGRTRTFFLRSAGWCKDMDPYTAFPDTVSPLPFRGMSGYPCGDGEEYPPGNRAWLLEWNTRQVLPR